MRNFKTSLRSPARRTLVGPGAHPFVHLGSAAALTMSNENGTVDDGQIHGAYRLKERDK